MVKLIHLSVQDINSRIQQLGEEVKSTNLNKTKRRRLYHKICELRHAMEKPQELVVDPEQQRLRKEADKERRIQKKLQSKQSSMKELKNKKRHEKRCLGCGSRQHLLSECPQTQTGYCYKCGATDHTHKQCNHENYAKASCFYCGKDGHIARQCPTNEKGLYRKGGSCFGCGSVRHILKDCPTRHPPKGEKPGAYSNQEGF